MAATVFLIRAEARIQALKRILAERPVGRLHRRDIASLRDWVLLAVCVQRRTEREVQRPRTKSRPPPACPPSRPPSPGAFLRSPIKYAPACGGWSQNAAGRGSKQAPPRSKLPSARPKSTAAPAPQRPYPPPSCTQTLVSLPVRSLIDGVSCVLIAFALGVVRETVEAAPKFLHPASDIPAASARSSASFPAYSGSFAPSPFSFSKSSHPRLVRRVQILNCPCIFACNFLARTDFLCHPIASCHTFCTNSLPHFGPLHNYLPVFCAHACFYRQMPYNYAVLMQFFTQRRLDP